MKRFIHLAIALLLFCTCDAGAQVKHYQLKVVKEYPHDNSSYTQGLFFHDGQLFESTGQYGSSTFRRVDLATGKPLDNIDFNRKYFVEGSVMLDGNLYILTWESKVAFIYDAATLKYKSTFSYPREGWGLTTDGKHLIASDGSNRLFFMNGIFQLQKSISVTMNGRPVKYLNELEWIDGRIWANVYTTDIIVIINPSSGVVEGVIDCTGLLPEKYRDRNTDVLNGIAINPENGKIYLTGKNWKRMYEIRLEEKRK